MQELNILTICSYDYALHTYDLNNGNAAEFGATTGAEIAQSV
jgi:hypothetical protein